VRRWSIWKKLVVYPLILVVPVLAILAWVVIADTVGEPRMIDGRPDDAPRFAAMFLGFGVSCLYGVYLVCLGITKVIVSIPGGPKSGAK
jgi:hypothetical protein